MKIPDFWFNHFQLEFAAHIWCVSSIHEYYLLVDYEFVTPSATVWTSTQFFAWLMWFIKETLIKPYGCESMYFQHETSLWKYSQIFKKTFSNHLGIFWGVWAFYVVEVCAMLVRSDSRKYISEACLYPRFQLLNVPFLFQPCWTQSHVVRS